MVKNFLRHVVFFLLFTCVSAAHPQLLPANDSLNAQSVQRWMQTNRDIAPIMQAVDTLYATDAEMKAFDALPAATQDRKIDELLAAKNLQSFATQIVRKHGWKSVGEYRRLSTKLGNAIAAYFLFGKLGKVTEEQAKQLKEKADPAVLAVPTSDMEFVKRNEKALQQYIQAYAAGN